MEIITYKLKDVIEYKISPSGQKKKLCKVLDCRTICRKGGCCVRHGGKFKKCSVDGCEKFSQKGELISV